MWKTPWFPPGNGGFSTSMLCLQYGTIRYPYIFPVGFLSNFGENREPHSGPWLLKPWQCGKLKIVKALPPSFGQSDKAREIPHRPQVGTM